MDWAGKPHPLERIVECGAPLVLAIAAGWSARLANLPLAAILASGMLALAIGMVAMRLGGRGPVAESAAFELAEFEATDADDELLLDDPLVEATPDSRVVRLFEQADPTPGELVLRISDYLNDGGRAAAPEAPTEQQYPDASDALHAALANIRASLR
jgi:hypothetical protein